LRQNPEARANEAQKQRENKKTSFGKEAEKQDRQGFALSSTTSASRKGKSDSVYVVFPDRLRPLRDSHVA
jgi:hypothetical protein